MAKITLTDLANLQNETTAVTAINNNNAAIETAFENTLSRDGTSPNKMSADLDMDSNRILNLPEPLSANEPIRLQDITNFQGDVIPTSVIPADPPDLFLVSNGTAYVPRAIVGSDLPNPSLISLGGTFAKPLVSGQVLGGISTAGLPQVATNGVFTSADGFALAVGRQGATSPALQVDASTANSVTGLKVTAQAIGNGYNVEVVGGGANEPLIVNAKGSGTINFGTNSTGAIIMFQDVLTNGAHSINGQMAARTLKGNSTGGAALSTDLTPQQTWVLLNSTRYMANITGINFNSANTDTAIVLPTAPTGHTRYSVRACYIVGASATLNPATCGMFTQAAGAGNQIIGTGTAVTVTSTADATNNNMQVLGALNANSMSHLLSSLTSNTMYFRVQTASAGAATASLMFELQWLP